MHWGMFLWVIKKILVILAALLISGTAFLTLWVLWVTWRRRRYEAEGPEERQLREDQGLIEWLFLTGRIGEVRPNGELVSKDTASTDWL